MPRRDTNARDPAVPAVVRVGLGINLAAIVQRAVAVGLGSAVGVLDQVDVRRHVGSMDVRGHHPGVYNACSSRAACPG